MAKKKKTYRVHRYKPDQEENSIKKMEVLSETPKDIRERDAKKKERLDLLE